MGERVHVYIRSGGWIYEWVVRCMDGWDNQWTDKYIEKWHLDGWVVGWMGGRQVGMVERQQDM